MSHARAEVTEAASILVAFAAALCALGAAVGFAGGGLALGLAVGVAVAAGRALSRSALLRPFAPAILCAAGAAGATLAAIAFGSRYGPQLIAAAAFGWAAGLAATAALAMARPRRALPADVETDVETHVETDVTGGPGARRLVLACLAGLGVLYLAFPLAYVVRGYAGAILIGVDLALLVAAIIVAWVTANGRARGSVALVLGTGAAAGLVFGLLGQWWFGLGAWTGWEFLASPWLAGAAAGMVLGLAAAGIPLLARFAARRSGTNWAESLAVVLPALILGAVTPLMVMRGRPARFRLAYALEAPASAVAWAAILAAAYLILTRARSARSRLAAAAAVLLPMGALAFGPWPKAAGGFAVAGPARMLAAPVPWKTALGDDSDPRPRLVYRANPYRGLGMASLFADPAVRRGADEFRCVALGWDSFHELTERLEYAGRNPSALFLTPGGEEIEAVWGGCRGPSCDDLVEAMGRVVDGAGTFLHWKRLAAREPGNAEALWRLAEGLGKRGRPERMKEAMRELSRLPVGENTHAAQLLFGLVGTGEREAALRLVKAGVDVGFSTERGWTALHCAAFKGFADVARGLVEAGADPDAESSRGETPLGLAIARLNGETAAFLIEAGARASDEDGKRLAATPENEVVFSGGLPTGAATDERGAVYWHDSESGALFVLEPGATSGRELARLGIRQIIGASLDAAAGTLYVLENNSPDTMSGLLVAVDVESGRRRTLAEGTLTQQTVCASPAGDVFFTEFVRTWASGHHARVFALHAGSSEKIIIADLEGRPAASAFLGPGRVAFAVSDREKDSSRIVELSVSDGSTRTIAEVGIFAGRLDVDRAGNLYVAGALPDRDVKPGSVVLRVPPGGEPERVLECSWPWAMAVSPEGGALYASFGGETLRRITLPPPRAADGNGAR